jgi:hypothetical protein
MDAQKSNVDLLIDKGALDPDDLTEEHARIINEEFEPAEMDTLVKMQQKIKKQKLGSGAAF